MAVATTRQQAALAFLCANIQMDAASGCWNWTGNLLKNGYGQSHAIDGVQLVHRIMYRLTTGPLVPGMEVHHTCWNRRCVNPDHLVQLTPAENDRLRRRTHCKRGHDYAVTGRNRANCAQCNRDRERARYHAKKASQTTC